MINLTYTGSCSVDGNVIMCSSMSANLDQKLLFFDHSKGLRDEFIQGQYGITKGTSASGVKNTQKKVYRHSPALARGSISGPIPVDGFQTILDKAISGEELKLNFVYHRRHAPEIIIDRAIITSLSINLKAADIATFSMEVVGAEYNFNSSGNVSSTAECAKLITWDVCKVNPTGINNDIASFNMTINNPAVPIYTSKWTTDNESGGMMPQKIRVGMQEVTGTIGFYGSADLAPPKLGVITLGFLCGVNISDTKMAVAYYSPKDDASSGPYIKVINFVGVNDGSIWL